MRVRIEGGARAEIREAKQYLKKEKKGLDEQFEAELREAIKRIHERPQIGSPYELGSRRIHLDRLRYAVIYLVTDKTLDVVAVSHHRRAADYWHNRVQHSG